MFVMVENPHFFIKQYPLKGIHLALMLLALCVKYYSHFTKHHCLFLALALGVSPAQTFRGYPRVWQR